MYYPIIITILIQNFLIFIVNSSNLNIINIGTFYTDIPPSPPINYIIYHNNFQPNNVKINNTLIKLPTASKELFQSAKLMCGLIQDHRNILAIIGSTPPTSTLLQSMAIQRNLPFLQTNWLPANLFLQNNDISVNFFPDSNLLAQGLNRIIDHLQWSEFIIIYQSPDALIRLKEVLTLENCVIIKQIDSNDLNDITLFMKHSKQLNINNFIIDCDSDLMRNVFEIAQRLGLLEMGFNYFIPSLDANLLDFKQFGDRANITSLTIFDSTQQEIQDLLKIWETNQITHGNLNNEKITTQTILIHDAFSSLVKSINLLLKSQLDSDNIQRLSCDNDSKLEIGSTLVTQIKSGATNLFPLSGPIEFDTNGNRINFTLYLIQQPDNYILATWNPKNPDQIIYTHNPKVMITGLQRGVLKVASRLTQPYLMVRSSANGNKNLTAGNDCFEGFCVDLIKEIAKICNFSYEIYLVDGNSPGSFNVYKNSWTGIIKEVIENEAQLGLADLTITPDREEVVDFSMPYMRLGIGVMYKKTEDDKGIFRFLDPLTVEVWMYTGALLLSIAILLYFVARMAPGDWENPHPCNQNPKYFKNIWNIKNCIWLSMGSIMNQGCDILPRGISSRLVSSTWWIFALIITQSYIASLAAFLTKQTSIDIKEIPDLAKQSRITYGALAGTATEEFFRNSNDSVYMKMYETMVTSQSNVFETSMESAVKRMRSSKNEFYALLTESTTIEYVVERNCDLKSVKKPINQRTFGIAMARNYPFRTKIDDAILQLQEKGHLLAMKNKWWREMKKTAPCIDKQAGAELTVQQLGGVFLILAAGALTGILLGIVEFLVSVWHISVKQHLSFWQAFKLELVFALKVWISQKRIRQPINNKSKEEHCNNKEKQL